MEIYFQLNQDNYIYIFVCLYVYAITYMPIDAYMQLKVSTNENKWIYVYVNISNN